MSDNMVVRAVSSYKVTSSQQLTAKDSVILGVVLINGGAACSVKIADGGVTGGNEIVTVADTTSTANTTSEFEPGFEISVAGGIYINLSGANAYCYVFYRQIRA